MGSTTVISWAEARLAASINKYNSMSASFNEYPLTSANDWIINKSFWRTDSS